MVAFAFLLFLRKEDVSEGWAFPTALESSSFLFSVVKPR